jgi:hypothetical protein
MRDGSVPIGGGAGVVSAFGGCPPELPLYPWRRP